MKYKKLLSIIISSVILLSGCKSSPKDAVVRKNDGSLDVNKEITATEPMETQNQVTYSESFNSRDNSVTYHVNISEEIPDIKMPVIELEPYFLTGEDAQKVCKVLFGDAEVFISTQRNRNVVYSKEEIQEKLRRWSKYTNNEAIADLFGFEKKDSVDIVNIFIQTYTDLLETAPEESQKEHCSWEYRKESFYYAPEDQQTGSDLLKENDTIKAELTVNNIPYSYNVVKRDLSDFKMSRISAYPYDGTCPDNIDEFIFRALMCRTDKPTQEQIDNIQKKAEKMLEGMELGEWQVDQCYLSTQTYGDAAEYTICVKAVPVFEGIASIRRPQLRNLASDSASASNLYLTDAEFQFSANGDIVYFELNSPLVPVSVVNNNVKTLTMPELLERAKEQLQIYNDSQFGVSSADKALLEEYYKEKLICNVSIEKMDYGLTRVKAPDSNAFYYYVPSVILYGTANYCGEKSGNNYLENDLPQNDNGLIPILALNAMDGSIIPLKNDQIMAGCTREMKTIDVLNFYVD